jgi:Ca2+-binding EF-hand superfamily protein
MLLALGAASSAIDALKALTSSKPPSPANQDAANLFAFSADASASAGSSSGPGSGGGSISPETMSALLAAQSQSGSAASAPMSRSDALKDLFAQIDADGDGKITKSEFENALGAGGTNLAQADDVFSKLDKDGDASVSLGEMAAALKGGKGHHRHHHVASGSGDGTDADPLMQALQGATSTSTTNADGSVTTSLTYADGSKVTMTSASASGAAASSYNFIEQMIAREAKAISAQTSSSLSVSV